MPNYSGAYSGGAPALPGRTFVVGWYYPPMMVGADASSAMTQSREYCMRFEVGVATTFDRIGLEVTTGAASNVVRLGIRNDSGRCTPGTLILDAGTIDASGTGFLEKTISQRLNPGRYWLVAVLQGGTGAFCRMRTLDPGLGQDVSTTVNIGCFIQAGTTGALGTFTGNGAGVNGAPKVMLRAA